MEHAKRLGGLAIILHLEELNSNLVGGGTDAIESLRCGYDVLLGVILSDAVGNDNDVEGLETGLVIGPAHLLLVFSQVAAEDILQAHARQGATIWANFLEDLLD